MALKMNMEDEDMERENYSTEKVYIQDSNFEIFLFKCRGDIEGELYYNYLLLVIEDNLVISCGKKVKVLRDYQVYKGHQDLYSKLSRILINYISDTSRISEFILEVMEMCFEDVRKEKILNHLKMS